MASEELSRDTAFRLLSHAYRRYLIDCLEQHGVPLTLADAAEEVAREYKGKPIPDIPAEEIKRIYMSLYHSQIPRLAEEDVIQYDQELDLVELTEQGEQLAAVQKRIVSSNFDRKTAFSEQ